MADYIASGKETFEYTYSAKQQDEIEKIRSKYLPKQESKMEQLRKLDKQAEQPGQIAALSIGIIGSLLLGIGMCCTMVWGTSMMVFVFGIIIGVIGICIACTAYPVYTNITKKQREKVADKILALSAEITLE